MLDENDLPWLDRLGRARYDSRFDPEGTEVWFKNIVLKSPLLFLPIRTDNAFLIAMLSCVPWTPATFEVNVIMLCAEEGCMWEGFKLLRVSVEWARRRKASTWRIASETDYDFAPLARRMGATEISPRFVMRL